nr:enoyl-CoA hydratase-related protein [Micromonospora sp. DSM 115978]
LRKARELSLTGDFVDAAEAHRIGLVNHVVPHDDLLLFTRRLVRRFTDRPAAATVQALYDQGADLGLNAALAAEATQVASGPDWDAKAFAEAGSITAARSRRPTGHP